MAESTTIIARGGAYRDEPGAILALTKARAVDPAPPLCRVGEAAEMTSRAQPPFQTPSLATVCCLAVPLVACMQPGGSLPAGAAREATMASASKPSLVTIGIGGEPQNLASKFDSSSNSFREDFQLMANSALVVLTPQGTPQLRLAADTPSRDRGTWTVNPDGTMATTWKVRPDALWQDGRPITSTDFAFALQLYLDDDLSGADRNPERLMDSIETIDAGAFTIHWRFPYPTADQLLPRELEPLPEHILGPLYRSGDKRAFQGASFWTTPDYVGSGPYRLIEWEPGSRLVYRAFDGYFLGRPKIDQVVFHVIKDSNAVVANLLSGAVDATVNITLTVQGAEVVKQEWDRSGEGQIWSYPINIRAARIQQKPVYTKQPALRDPRVRRALLYGVDRQAIADTASGGLSPVPEGYLTTGDPLHARVLQVAPRYPFDRSRALALLQEAGWSKQGDRLVDASDQRFTLDIRTSQVAGNVVLMALMANDLGALGMDVSQTPVPQTARGDLEYRASFPGLQITATAIFKPTDLRIFTSVECPGPENALAGRNDGCWSNPDFDRAAGLAIATLDEREREAAVVDAIRVLLDDAAVVPLDYPVENIAARRGLIGPGARLPAQRGATWNIHEWRWSS